MTAKTILVTNEKGGVGKTTTATTLAVGAAARLPHGRVLLIDTDPQGSAATGLGVNPNGRCLSYLLAEESTYSEQIVRCDASEHGGPTRPNLFLLPASKRLLPTLQQMAEDIGAMKELSGKMSAGARKQMGLAEIPTLADTFERIMTPLKKAFDYIFIDSQPSLGLLQNALLRYADFAVVPTQVDYHSVEQVARHTATILESQQAGLPVRLLAVVPTFVDPRLSLTQELWPHLARTYGRQLAKPIPKRTDIAKGPALGGLTIFEYKPDSDAAIAYGYLLDRVMAV